MRTTIFLCLLYFGGIHPAFAQDPTTDELIREFFSVYEQGKPGEAIDLLYSSNSAEWLEQIQGSIDKVRASFQNLEGIVGAYYGKEKLTEESLGSSFKTIIFLVKYDRQPIRFIFQYYRPQGQWRLYGFSYDDKLVDDHEEWVKQKLAGQ